MRNGLLNVTTQEMRARGKMLEEWGFASSLDGSLARRACQTHVAKQCGQIAGQRSQIKSPNARADLKVVLVTEKRGQGEGGDLVLRMELLLELMNLALLGGGEVFGVMAAHGGGCS